MGAIHVLRAIAIFTTLLFSAIIIALSAHIIFTELGLPDMITTTGALGIASGALSLIFLTTMFIFGQCARRSFPTKVAFELTVFGILSILFLATGGVAADVTTTLGIDPSCKINYIGDIYGDVYSEDSPVCHEFMAVEALSFLSWLILMGYAIILLIFAIIASVRGRRGVWTESVLLANFLGPRASSSEKLQVDGQQHYIPTTPFTPQYTGSSGVPAQSVQYSNNGTNQYPPQQHNGYPTTPQV